MFRMIPPPRGNLQIIMLEHAAMDAYCGGQGCMSNASQNRLNFGPLMFKSTYTKGTFNSIL